uniref:Fumarylacetoacetate hydrolase domain containing 2A n=1 Tax=Leptobrachium leishanense TaxID=445787 RepID=A0A8C5MBZ7_9ANUR
MLRLSCWAIKAPQIVLHSIPRRSISLHQTLRMRLVQFQHLCTRKIGLELEAGGNVVDLNAFDSSLPCGMKEFLEAGETALQKAKRALDSGQHILNRSQITLLAPVTNPEKIICVGMNYVDHCLEQNVPVPKEPIIFSKFTSSIVGPSDAIILPKESKEEDGMAYVAGFTVAHDVSARDWQMKKNGKQWLLGKTFDTFCPIGPALVTKDSISDPHCLGIRCRVNGDLVQDSNTNQMVFKTEALVAWVSKFVTLKPGDLFLTGTPPGVGVFRKPPVFLKAGDVVDCEIDELGVISNPVL